MDSYYGIDIKFAYGPRHGKHASTLSQITEYSQVHTTFDSIFFIFHKRLTSLTIHGPCIFVNQLNTPSVLLTWSITSWLLDKNINKAELINNKMYIKKNTPSKGKDQLSAAQTHGRN